MGWAVQHSGPSQEVLDYVDFSKTKYVNESSFKTFILAGIVVQPLNSSSGITYSPAVLRPGFYFWVWVVVVVKIHVSSLPNECPCQPGYEWGWAVMKAERKQNVFNQKRSWL